MLQNVKQCPIKLSMAVIMSCSLLSAQHVHPMSSSSAAPGLPVLVDGSKNPEKIPDNLAYWHFFAAVAAHVTPTAKEQGRQNAQLLALNLSAVDRQNFVAALAGFRATLDGIEATLLAQASAAQVVSLRQQKDSLLSSTMAALNSSLTADGLAKLNGYVTTHVKQHIVIYGGSTM